MTHPSAISVYGGSFLFEKAGERSFFIPEEFGEEHHLLKNTVQKFVAEEILPRAEAIEKKDYPLLRSLIRKTGELGLNGVVVPEEYGGLGGSEIMAMIVTENMAGLGSWVVTFGAHTGIGTLPILYFGTPEQKARYLPKLVSGEWVGAYALTEPTSGSDALGAKTRAIPSEDGKYYLLTGTKQFITNAGFADLFVVFAKVNGDAFTAFLVERTFPGVSIGREEEKMGLKGSSTCQLILENTPVPRENLLGEIGKGHRIAFSILNVGRFKLGVGAVGAMKRILKASLEYARERKQFGVPIVSFPLIGEKLAGMALKIFAGESMAYRLAGDMDEHLIEGTRGEGGAIKAISEFSVESSILKVYGSEMLDEVVDDAVQIHGGYGYIGEYMVERAYRDSRINRIFEGTNEINRLLIPAMLLKGGLRGTLPLFQIEPHLSDLPSLLPEAEEGIEFALPLVEGSKILARDLLRSCAMAFGENLEKEQEILAQLANLTIEAYALDSLYGRTSKVKKLDPQKGERMELFLSAYLTTSALQILSSASAILGRMEGGKGLFRDLILPWLTPYLTPSLPLIELKRRVAEVIEKEGGYPF